jgi:hypothetical protein
MPAALLHVIRELTLHVELNGTESDGLTVQRRLSDLCEHWLTPVIERALERCTPENGTLHIERLEVDVGTLSLERLEHDLTESLEREIE